MANGQKTTVKRVLARVKRFWPGLIASMLLAAVYVVISLYIPILVGNAIDCIVEAGNVDLSAMGIFLGKVAVCALIAGGAQWVMTRINNAVTFQNAAREGGDE